MGKIFDDPKFPVVDKAPGFWKTVQNFNLSDMAMAGGAAGLSIPVGYFAGASKSPAFARVSGNLLRSSMVAAAAVGTYAGFLLAFQASAGRLMGYFPNEAEVAAAGSR